MKALILYRPNTEHELSVQQYARDFARHTGKDLPLVDVDSREGSELAQLYDVMKFPSIIAIDDMGRMLQLWDSEMLPRFDEVNYYTES